MASQPVKGVVRQVKPLLSKDLVETKRRVLSLYKAWYRELPEAIIHYGLPVSNAKAKAILKNEFLKHKYVRDVRVIDMLVIKGQMELKETAMRWKQGCHIMYMTKQTHIPKPNTFLSKFLAGSD